MAYYVRPLCTDAVSRRYFLPALTAKIVGALAVGFIYQFYYSGGDTFNYHTHGSRIIWNAFWESPTLGVKLFFNDESATGAYKYYSQIPFFFDSSSFTVIQCAAFFDLLTFSSYSGTAVFFAVISFTGSWMFFWVFSKMYPSLQKEFAFAVFFIPSVVFWGSGLLKDTITLSCVGIALYAVYHIFIDRKPRLFHFVILLISFYLLYRIKIYILLTLLPALIVWVFFVNLSRLKNSVIRALSTPIVIFFAGGLATFATLKAGEDNPRYSINKIAQTAQVTAYDIRYWTGKEAGSGYTLGELDGTFQSMLRLAPAAINVSLFRPYLWEVNNPLMLLSAIESVLFLFLTVFILVRYHFLMVKAFIDPTILFCFLFSIVFAFAVGVSTYNFGTLVRYKIPMMPFFAIALILINDQLKRLRKV